MLDKGFSLTDKEYNNIPDEKIVQEIQQGDQTALNYLMGKYQDVVKMKANKFFMVGAERDDMIQEGLIGLYKATKDFNAEKQNSFKTFANLCIERQLITAIKTANRQKNIPLNSAFSLNAAAYDEEDDIPVMEILNTKMIEDPLDIITRKEYFHAVEKQMDESLSNFEREVLKYYKQGKSYAAIAEIVGCKVKSVDTAIQRIRKKTLKIKEAIEADNNHKTKK